MTMGFSQVPGRLGPAGGGRGGGGRGGGGGAAGGGGRRRRGLPKHAAPCVANCSSTCCFITCATRSGSRPHCPCARGGGGQRAAATGSPQQLHLPASEPLHALRTNWPACLARVQLAGKAALTVMPMPKVKAMLLRPPWSCRKRGDGDMHGAVSASAAALRLTPGRALAHRPGPGPACC